MNWTEARNHLRNSLPDLEDREKDSLFFLIYEDLTQERKSTFWTENHRVLSIEDEYQFKSIVGRLEKDEPLQYILGKSHFFGRDFIVNPSVLIPRPETEELVHWALSEVLLAKGKMLDMGTGSGCIALTWAAECPNWEVSGWDISDDALDTARLNGATIAPKAHFEKRNLLQLDTVNEPFDLIISNPPYVRYSEQKEMHARVKDYEPNLALYVPDNDPLLFYKAIGAYAFRCLRQDGHLFLEINQYLGKETRELFVSLGFSLVHLRTDLSGNERLMHVRK